MNVPRIRGLIAEKFRTPAEFARRLGWQRDKLYRILRKETKLTADEVLDMAGALGIMDSPDEVVSIFIK